jgi:hypothetical protein
MGCRSVKKVSPAAPQISGDGITIAAFLSHMERWKCGSKAGYEGLRLVSERVLTDHHSLG